jgi:hypothetical protein
MKPAMKRPAFLLALLCLALLLLVFVAPAAPRKAPCDSCNVMLIMIDALGAGHIGAYGYERDTMPRTEAFFRERGTIFMNAHAPSSWTLPSFMSLFFSDLPSRISYADIASDRERLQSAVRAGGGEVRGLILPPWFFIGEAIAMNFEEGETTDFIKERTAENLPALGTVLTRWRAERAVSGAPFFGFAHTFIVHDPYDPASEYLELFEKEERFPTVGIEDLKEEAARRTGTGGNAPVFALRYDQEIREADDLLGAFLESLSEDALADTVIIVSSDHGEAFGEHGFFWHGHTLYEEETRIPLMVYAPGGTAAVSRAPVSLMDIAPTVLELMGVPVPASFAGESFAPLLYGSEGRRRAIVAEHGTPFFETGTKETPVLLADVGALGSPEPVIEVQERAQAYRTQRRAVALRPRGRPGGGAGPAREAVLDTPPRAPRPRASVPAYQRHALKHIAEDGVC